MAKGDDLFPPPPPVPLPDYARDTSVDRVEAPWSEEDLESREETHAPVDAQYEEYEPTAGTPTEERPPRKQSRVKVMVTGRMAQLLRGEITVDDLDDEELRRGELRNAAGGFSGTKTQLVPREMHDAMVRRLLQRGQEKLRHDYFAAIDTMTSIALDDTVDPAVRLRAADMVITRVAGKPVEKVELAVEVKPYEGVVKKIFKARPSIEASVVEAELVDDDDE